MEANKIGQGIKFQLGLSRMGIKKENFSGLLIETSQLSIEVLKTLILRKRRDFPDSKKTTLSNLPPN